MPTVDITSWERHNVVIDNQGRLMTRRGFTDIFAPAGGSVIVAGFSLLVPSSSEVEHIVFMQVTSTGQVTMTTYDEEFNVGIVLALGKMASAPVITMALVNNQVMINSPSFSSPLYGLPGGGYMPALKVASINPDTTALDIPTGHICSFGDRMPIAQGSVVYFNDPGIDPRTYVAQNTLGLPGEVYDIFQGPDGGLWMFTAAGLFVMSADALGQGQSVVGFVQLVPSLVTSNPHNAVTTPFGVVALTRTGISVLSSSGASRDIDFPTYQGRRQLSRPVEIEDVRQFGRVYVSGNGVVVGFGADRDYFVIVDLAHGGAVTFVSASDRPVRLVGMLHSRDDDDIFLTSAAALVMHTDGVNEFASTTLTGTTCGKMQEGPADDPLIRRISVSVGNGGGTVATGCNGRTDTGKTTSVNGDVVADLSVWGTARYAGLTTRSVRTTLNVRATEPNVEVRVEGGGRRIAPALEVQAGGVWRTRKETQQ